MDVGPSESETFWTAFLRRLPRCVLRGVELVTSDSYKSMKAAVSGVLAAPSQRCRVQFRLNVLAHTGRQSRRVTSAFTAIFWDVGAILLAQNDKWTVQRTPYMTLETITALRDDPLVSLQDLAP